MKRWLLLWLAALLLAGCGTSKQVEQPLPTDKDFAEVCAVMYEIARARNSAVSLVGAEGVFYKDKDKYPLDDWADECLADNERIYKALGQINRDVLSKDNAPSYKDVYTAFNDFSEAFIRNDEIFRMLIQSPDNQELKTRFDESSDALIDAADIVDMFTYYFFREYCNYRDIGLYLPYENDEEDTDTDAETGEQESQEVEEESEESDMMDDIVQEPDPTEYTSEGTPINDGFKKDAVPMQKTDRSSCFSEIGYDESEGLLVVTFRSSGASYLYYAVPEDVWEALASADSIGHYYNEEIKGEYTCEKLK